MNPESGNFICPNCKEAKLDVYTNWLSQYRITDDNKNERHWIFYYKTMSNEKKFGFILIKFFEHCSVKITEFSVLTFVKLFFLVQFFYILYISILIWVDIIIYVCSKNKYNYTYLSNINDNEKFNESLINYNDNENNIWRNFGGIPEGVIALKSNDLFRCLKCNYNPKSFKDFIPNLSTIKNDESNNIINNNNNINITDSGSNEISNNYIKLDSNNDNI